MAELVKYLRYELFMHFVYWTARYIYWGVIELMKFIIFLESSLFLQNS